MFIPGSAVKCNKRGIKYIKFHILVYFYRTAIYSEEQSKVKLGILIGKYFITLCNTCILIEHKIEVWSFEGSFEFYVHDPYFMIIRENYNASKIIYKNAKALFMWHNYRIVTQCAIDSRFYYEFTQ